jgi:hypothetical protein
VQVRVKQGRSKLDLCRSLMHSIQSQVQETREHSHGYFRELHGQQHAWRIATLLTSILVLLWNCDRGMRVRMELFLGPFTGRDPDPPAPPLLPLAPPVLPLGGGEEAAGADRSTVRRASQQGQRA